MTGLTVEDPLNDPGVAFLDKAVITPSPSAPVIQYSIPVVPTTNLLFDTIHCIAFALLEAKSRFKASSATKGDDTSWSL